VAKLFEHVKIQTNNLCTRKCPYCYFGNCPDPEKIELSEYQFKKIVDNLSDLKFRGRIGYFETNEPLTDSRIFDFISYSKRKNPEAWHMIASNGDLLDIAKLKLLFDSGLDEIKISTYDHAAFSKAEGFRSATSYNIEILDQRQPVILDNRGGNIEYGEYSSPAEPLKSGCDRIHKVLCIRPSGNIVSCCCDFNEQNIFGSINDSRLEEIWSSDPFEKFRTVIDGGDRTASPLCSKCNYAGQGGFFKSSKRS